MIKNGFSTGLVRNTTAGDTSAFLRHSALGYVFHVFASIDRSWVFWKTLALKSKLNRGFSPLPFGRVHTISKLISQTRGMCNKPEKIGANLNNNIMKVCNKLFKLSCFSIFELLEFRAHSMRLDERLKLGGRKSADSPGRCPGLTCSSCSSICALP